MIPDSSLQRGRRQLASSNSAGVQYGIMRLPSIKRVWLAVLSVLVLVLVVGLPIFADGNPDIFPLSEIKPGMKGVAYTIISGDKVEKIDLVVIGTLQNALGPKEDVVLVQLLGDQADHVGVASGMSGSPVYFNGKLAGALSLKLGQFTKEAIGGMTPIESMLDVQKSSTVPAKASGAPVNSADNRFYEAPEQVPLPSNFAQSMAAGVGGFLVPIETPLMTAGIFPETLAQFGKQFSSWGMATMAGGSAAPTPEDASLKPGDMVGMDLIRGDISMSAGCTVTSVVDNNILACGHPLFGLGSVALPLSRAHVLMTLASSANSTKVMTTGGTIGTLTQDRTTAVMGTLGAGPSMIPVDVTLETPAAEKKFHFEVIESPQLTPLLVALSVFNGIVGTPAYGEGSTLQMDGTIDLKGHTPVELEDLFAPIDQPVPTGFFAATEVQAAFARIYSNPYEQPQIERVNVRVKALAERRWAMIDGAWVDKSEVHPGDRVGVKVLLRPYRGAPFVQEIPVTIPAQISRGTLELIVSDADFLNRNMQALASSSQGQLPGLEELIKLVNRERHNDRVYATILQSTPTMLVEDKEMPNVPASEISVLDQRQNPGGARVVGHSTAGEWSVDMHQVIAGDHMLTITVK